MAFVELKNIKKTYGKGDGKVEALKGIDLSIEKGDMLAIMGASGSGKSTLLNILGYIDKATEGSYALEGQVVEKLSDKALAKRRNKFIGFVVQNFALVEDYTVYQNIRIPLDYTKMTKKEKKQRINDLLTSMGIIDKKDKLPRELSGGQCQRVAIARALVNDPDLILADEPTGALDKKTGEEIMNTFIKLNEEGKTIVVITHDEKVAKMCKKIIYIEDGNLVPQEVKL
ncbi:ABC transporter ATP-binding protein [Inconstantimicrobium mannanitabidum]|uniref:Macrolide ABC transporter ATP-binding protein n=1 Tax=Inconstantimicrobium mannanitabidum TaxID=1604901 RepID=A0ACB5RIK5_9CLOT|nr:ABC transporter ATP-binding protein [Clostridium sp. TW13]GKX68922.1 macrolide ABC transporter ATP-binding protein [Clostridium sp. TW13]